MVDSAPELRLTTPSARTPSNVTPVAGTYIGAPAGFWPKNQPAATPARRRRPSERDAEATASNPSTRASAPYAIWLPAAGAGSQPLSGPVAVSRCGGNTAAAATAGPSRRGRPSAVAARASAEVICVPQACQSERDTAHGRIAPYGQWRASPAPLAAMPVASRSSAVRAGGGPPAVTYALRPRTASDVASAPSTISHAGTFTPCTVWYSP